jgi:Icc-related predicted phosphoesterase
MAEQKKKVKIAAVGDIHVKEHFRGEYREMFVEISEKADVLVLCGDLTDLGQVREAELLAEDLQACTIPVVGVLGNHDYQSDQPQKIREILEQHTNVCILDQEPIVHHGVGFAGVKGFIGGFGEYALGAFGEPELKKIVIERDNQAFALENQLKQLVHQQKKVVVMHYSPIRETVAGEAADIMPFLGSTRYAQVIDQYGAEVVFHGHANLGPHSGKTHAGIPVFNVALPLLQNLSPKLQYKLYEV